MSERSTDHVINSVEALRAHYGTPTTIARDKVIAQLDDCLLYTSDAADE